MGETVPTVWGDGCDYCDRYGRPCGRHESTGPVVVSVKVARGVAGVVSATARVQYRGEPVRWCTFTGNVYGGPVAYTFESAAAGAGMVSGFVAEPGRFGEFAAGPESWVRRFYAE